MTATPDTDFVSFPELRALGVPFSRNHVQRLIKQKLFPEGVWLSANRRAWRRSEIIEWLRSRSATRPVTPPEHKDETRSEKRRAKKAA
jgi:prophage regulatory protein